MRRVRRHVLLGAGSFAAIALVFGIIPSDDPIFQASMATAYVALGLLAVTLAFGPVASLRGRRYPVSTDIRRDYGIWSAIVALVHVVVGLQVHLRGKMHEYFVQQLGVVPLPRADAFGVANYAGAVAGLILVALLVTSNDMSLRRLGTDRWRTVHALASWGLVLTLLHGAVYQAVEKRAWSFVLAFAVLAFATTGLRLWAHRHAHQRIPAGLRGPA